MDPSYVNLLTAAKHFNVSSATVRIWIGKGAPHQKLEKTHGGIGAHYFVNLDELKNWLQERRAVGAGIGRLALQDFVPIVELKTLLQKLRTNLGWTKKQIAEELKISMSKLNTYLFPELYDLKNGPKYLISKIEYLLLYGAKKQHPLSLPSKQQVVEALQESSGIQKYAAEHLNIAASTLDKLIVKYALEDHLKKSADQRYTVKQLKRVIKKTHGNIREASEILGLGRDALNELLKKAKLQQILQRYRSAPRRKLLRDIKDGLKLHQGNLRAVG